ncbi:acyl-CoA dehydrogenase family protein [Kitasatospora paracochleata]|uniref:Alkylation response protein AidB-like acyl-CoA dehydrogenase n=1 Tax=Kitasatospora paracochleata TaxID=58354 RepID=A0ABT1JA77_9ACTN|nr:acyl-CoA dehydrogenase [Kitasatospora paracochleata]MCP2314361.1 alkylation response protein AidB-like acyl-CoA dehydrogenase [Kitasatospora paracochleata]
MVELDERLRALRGAAAETAGELRAHAAALDAAPHDLKPHLGVAAFDLIRRCTTPQRFGGEPLRVGRHAFTTGSSLETLVWMTELAHGDAGMVLAAPGPSLAGILLDQLGDQAQQEYFHRAVARDAVWAFFAVTEPGHGSDAGAMESTLHRTADIHLLNGAKRFIGNGARGEIGVVFARTGSGPLSVRAALVEAADPGFRARELDMVGLRGAALGAIELRDVPVPEDRLLARHLPATRRGLWGAVRVFNTVRPQVAALAVGTGLACLDLVRAERPQAPGLAELAGRLESCRRLVYAAGAALDRDRDDAVLSSAAKVAAVAAARAACRFAVRSLGPAALVDHPLLEKWYRDVGAFEFMEGTSDIQRLHVARAEVRGRTGGRR